MPVVRSTFTIRLSVRKMDAIEKQEADLKKKLDDCDTLGERREIRRQLRELRKKAEELEANKDINANIVSDSTVSSSKINSEQKHDEKQSNDDADQRVRSAEERRSRRERRLNEKNKEKEEDTTTSEEHSGLTQTRPKEREKRHTSGEEKSEKEKEQREESGRPQQQNQVVEEKEEEQKTETKEERDKESKSQNNIAEDSRTTSSSIKKSSDPDVFGDNSKTEDSISSSATSCSSSEQNFEAKMNGPMRSLSLRNKDSSDGREGNKFDRGLRSSLFGDKNKARGTIGKALSVSQMKEKFGQGGTSKPVEFGSSFAKATPEKIQEPVKEMAKPSPVTSNLRETNPSESYRREVPRPKQHHYTAPAGIIPPKQEESKPAFTAPGLGGSAADRLAFFRQAAEQEKAKKEREAERQRLLSAPAEINTEAKENRTAPCKKKLENKRPLKRTKSISSIVLDWCKEMVRDYGVEIKNFSSSWNDGMAFCALIHHFESDAFDFKELSSENREQNFRLAFETANKRKNIPILLDVDDMVRMKNPEPRSVQCYIQWIWRIYGPTSGSYNEEEIKAAQVA